MELHYRVGNIFYGAFNRDLGNLETHTMIKNIFAASYFLFLCGCTTLIPQHPDDVYYVIDIHGTEPDAEFVDKDDAQQYVEKYKEFHTYRIVKAQHYTSRD